MKLNLYREIGYEDDGVTGFQCLCCKEKFGMRHGKIRFCPACGEQITLVETRPAGTPRWAYERYGTEIPEHIQSRMWCPKRVQLLPEWELQSRTKWKGEDWGEWKNEWNMGNDTAHGAYDDLKRKRDTIDHDDDNWLMLEYRVVIRK